jgi:hypothetical protein
MLKSYLHGHLDDVICNMVWCLVACDVEISKFLCELTNTTHTLNCHQISLSANHCKFFCWPSYPSNASGAFSVICILHHWPGTKVVAIEEIAQAIVNRMPLRIIENQGLRITKNSGTSYMWGLWKQYWFGERASVVTFRIAQNSAPSWWWWCVQYVSSIQPSSIRYAWGVLWKFVKTWTHRSLSSYYFSGFFSPKTKQTNQMWRRRRAQLAKLQFVFKKPYWTFSLSMSHSFFHRTVVEKTLVAQTWRLVQNG